MRLLLGVFILSLITATPAKADESDCIAEAVYFEARGESVSGMLAVVEVILNRVAHSKFPSTACAVVAQGEYWRGVPVRNRCHFSYYCDGKPETIEESAAYRKVRSAVFLGLISYIPSEALYYHTTKVRPYWASKFKRLYQKGNHIFYGEK